MQVRTKANIIIVDKRNFNNKTTSYLENFQINALRQFGSFSERIELKTNRRTDPRDPDPIYRVCAHGHRFLLLSPSGNEALEFYFHEASEESLSRLSRFLSNLFTAHLLAKVHGHRYSSKAIRKKY